MILTKIKVITLPNNGLLKLSGTPVVEEQEINVADIVNLTFEPNENWNGNTSFEWKGHDGTVYSETAANVDITIDPVNDAPTITTVSKTGTEDTVLTFNTIDFTDHYTDTEGSELTKIKIVNLPTNGVLKLSGAPIVENQEITTGDLSNLTFEPSENWNGDTTFEWKGHDGTEYSESSANVDITIDPVNDAPTVTTVSKTGTEDITLAFTAADFTSQFSDIESDTLTKVKIITLPNNGTLKLSGTPVVENQEINTVDLVNLTFEPSENWNGDTTFEWKGHDGTKYSSTAANVDITIDPVNDAPTVTTVSKTGTEDTALTFTASDFTSHFSDVENDNLTKIKVVSLPSNGILKLSGTPVVENQEINSADLTNLTFEPSSNWNGNTSFEWRGHDGTIYAESSANVNITIDPVNDAPVVTAVSKTGTEDTVLTFNIIDFTDHYTDTEGSELTKIKVITLPTNGTLKLSGIDVTINQEINTADLVNLTFEPSSNWNGNTTFEWKGHDGTAYSENVANVDITIDPVNDAPVVTAVSKTGTEDIVLTFTATDFTNHFSDIDNDTLTKIQVVSLPSNGTLRLSNVPVVENQEINTDDLVNLTFEPNENWNGNTNFEWKGYDGTEYSESTAIDITINAVNDSPELISTIEDTLYIEKQASISIDSSIRIFDLDNTTLTEAQVAISNHKTDDVLEFTPSGGIDGNYDPSTGKLILTKIANLTDYQAILQSVRYKNTADNPDTETRKITFIVNDGVDYSNIITNDIFIKINEEPTSIDTATVVGSAIGGFAFFAGLFYTLYQCKQNGVGCFKAATAIGAAAEATTSSVIQLAGMDTATPDEVVAP